MKIKLICWLFLMMSIVSDVTAKLWPLEPEKDVEITNYPQQDPPEVTVVASVSEKVEVASPKIPSCPKSSGYEMTVLKQFIGKLLSQYKPVMIPGSDDEKVEYNMKMKLSSLDLNKISSFLNDNGDIYEVEEVLTSMLGDVSSDEMLLSQLPKTFYEKYFGLITIVAPFAFGLLMFLSLKFMQLPFWILVRWIFFLIFVISVVWNWYFLYQVNYTKYTTAIQNGPPEECQENYKPNWVESFISSVQEIIHVPVDVCQEYHMITSVPPGLRVPPTEAISFCIVNTLLKPLSSVGENVGLFFQKLSQQIPFPILMIALVFILIVLIFVIIVCSGYSIGGLFIQLTPPPQKTPVALGFEDSKEIKEKLDKVMVILEKFPDIDADVKEMHEILQKNMKLALEDKQKLKCIDTSVACGDGCGDEPENHVD